MTDAALEIDPLPCPFCGGEPHTRVQDNGAHYDTVYSIYCTSCGAVTNGSLNPLIAAGKWNRRWSRRSDATPTAAVEREREECAKVADEIEAQQNIDLGAANSGGAGECAAAIRARKP
jgi:uncharacterized Zn finger protein